MIAILLLLSPSYVGKFHINKPYEISMINHMKTMAFPYCGLRNPIVIPSILTNNHFC